MSVSQIIAMGGGGFLQEPENPLLDRYVLAQAGKPRPKICFVSTAGGDADAYIARFYEAFRRHDCEPSHLSLYMAPLGSLEEYVLGHDVMYVGGGNTRNLLALWREWGLHAIMRKAWERGVVLAGVSAGSICWFEEGVTDSIPGSLTRLACLGFLKGSNCPHYGDDPERRPSYHRLMAAREIGEGFAADDGVALHFIGNDLRRVVSSRPKARAFRVTQIDGEVVEQVLRPEFLGAAAAEG